MTLANLHINQRSNDITQSFGLYEKLQLFFFVAYSVKFRRNQSANLFIPLLSFHLFCCVFIVIPEIRGVSPLFIQHHQTVDLLCMISHRQTTSHRYVRKMSTSECISPPQPERALLNAETRRISLKAERKSRMFLKKTLLFFRCRTSKFSSNRHRKLQPFRETWTTKSRTNLCE